MTTKAPDPKERAAEKFGWTPEDIVVEDEGDAVGDDGEEGEDQPAS